MKIPCLKINDDINTFLSNPIAFEQCCPEIEPCVTSYAFMDCLINTENDVNLLESSRILLIRLPRDPAYFFSRLSLMAEVRKSTYLDDVLFDANKYYNSKWNKWKRMFADLKLNYCGSPWLAMSVVAAALLLFLGFIQAYYSALSYYHM
ncbi:UPF0481 protein At3g47200-like [Elaeis guineensis]|uniref:UPF0481 protein At3g47200-like n=1 Tax=Elaeis guineensis var. tenera TaxID=51953 RepID=UPI003C6D9C10